MMLDMQHEIAILKLQTSEAFSAGHRATNTSFRETLDDYRLDSNLVRDIKQPKEDSQSKKIEW